MLTSILISGGCGFIGSNFIRYLLQKDGEVRVFNLDLLTYAGDKSNLMEIDPKMCINVLGDICDTPLVYNLLSRYGIKTIVHFAAESHVDRSIKDPSQFMKTNVMGTYSLLEAARKYWSSSDFLSSCRFHHVSTDEVYGTLEKSDYSWDETAPYAPNSPYSASKASSDHLVRAYHHTYGIPITISNCSNNYGAYQHPEKFIPTVIINGIANKPIPIYGDGLQIRDWLHVRDHCSAIYKILNHGKVGETYNIGGGNQVTNLELATTICNELDKLTKSATSHSNLLTFVEDRLGHDRRYAINSCKIGKELGWYPSIPVSQGIEGTVSWYLNNSYWWENILAKEK